MLLHTEVGLSVFFFLARLHIVRGSLKTISCSCFVCVFGGGEGEGRAEPSKCNPTNSFDLLCFMIFLVQERLTKQIAVAVAKAINPTGVGVIIEAW